LSETTKLIKDPVHGYISVPRVFFREFIDTSIFQRLRNIEQTSMRPLYPAAHHDRFIHSLGVFYLGKRYAHQLEQYWNKSQFDVAEDDWRRIIISFEVACLMHDCGHAPFSHTLEKYYNHPGLAGARRAERYLLELAGTGNFIRDYLKLEEKPADHEIFSAALVLDEYKEGIDRVRGDASLVARMITGCIHHKPNNIQKMENVFIELLNGPVIDVDKLDYIVRDTWASGVKNASIDIDRLISSAMLYQKNERIYLCYAKSSLSVFQSVVDARNYLYEWIYNHHIVLYYAYLLDKALNKVAESFGGDVFWDKVFSKDAFKGNVEVNAGLQVYLPTDGDITFLMKGFAGREGYECIDEFISRRVSRYALWKTYAEYRNLMNRYSISPKQMAKVAVEAASLIAEKYSCVESDVVVTPALAKHAEPEESELLVYLDGNLVSSTRLLTHPVSTANRFFYVFVPVALKEKRSEIIDLICNNVG